MSSPSSRTNNRPVPTQTNMQDDLNTSFSDLDEDEEGAHAMEIVGEESDKVLLQREDFEEEEELFPTATDTQSKVTAGERIFDEEILM